MKYLRRIYNYCTKTLFRKALSILLVILILLSSIKFVFLKPKEVKAADMLLGFNEGYGTSTNDNNAAVSALTITGATWKTEELCKTGKCLSYDGTQDYVSIADASTGGNLDFVASDSFTIEGWFRTSDTSAQRTLIAKYNSTAAGYKVYMDANGYLVFGADYDTTWTPTDSASTSTTAFDDNKWHFFSAVKVGTTSMTIYVDGIAYETDSSITNSTLANADTFYIGIDGDGTSNDYTGFIDEVKIYRSARTAAEIKSDYLGETPSRGVTASFGPDTSYISNGLTGYWILNDTADSSGNSLTLTNNGATTFVTAKFSNGSEHVPASSQYLSTATTIAGTKSVSFWTNPDATTNYYLSLTSGAYITSTSGTLSATGFTNPKIYVNGVETTTIIADSWQFVTVTTETAINANQFYIGRQDTNYYDGTLDEVRTYNRTFSPAEVQKLYNWAPGPVAYWKLDEPAWGAPNCSSSVANDSSGNGFGLTSCPSTTGPFGGNIGKYGNGTKFDGTEDYLENTSASLGIANEITLEAWVYINAAGATADKYIIDKTNNNNGYALIQNESPINVRFRLGNGTVYTNYTGASTLSTDQWYHFAGTLKSDGTVKVYLNGVEDGSGTLTGSLAAATGINFRIGTRTTNNYFNGTIDDVRVYNYARTPAQIIEDMNGGHFTPGGPVGSSVAYWKFDEGYGTTSNDNSINGNTLTLSTASWTNSGKFGKAFNGADNVRATRADDTDFDFVNGTDDFTISTWFNRGGTISNQEYLVDKHTTNDGFTLYMDSDGDIVCGIGDGTSFPEDTAGTTAANYDDTNWHHAVCVKSGTASLTLYIDGKQVAQDASLGANADMSNTGKLIIGDTDEVDGTDEWLGDIDEVKIFRSILTADAIKVLYNQSSSQSLGSLSTDSSNNQSNSDTDSYCPPGQGSTCTPPVAHWKLDENTGTATDDSSGNGYSGTLTNSPKWSAGKFGSAVNTNSASAHVLVVDPPSGYLDFNATDNGTYMAWVRSSTAVSDDFIYKGFGGGVPGYRARDEANGYAVCGISDTAANTKEVTATGYVINDGNWHHVACVIDGTGGNILIYVDGVFRNTASEGSETGSFESGTDFQIGRNSASVYWPGDIDEVKVYRYARTPAQIAWDYNRGGPVGWWKMDENTGTSANDSAGNSTAGTLTNTPTWATGKFNQAVSFAGSDQHILIGDDPDFDFADDEDMSITTWFKHSAASAQEVILSKYAAAGYKIIMESDGDITCGLDYDSTWTPTDSATSTLATYDDGNWHHIACVKTGATSLALYIDGVLITTDSSITATNTLTNADPLYLGIDADGTSNDFTGTLDDVRIYRYPLTIQQIKTVMNNGSAVKF